MGNDQKSKHSGKAIIEKKNLEFLNRKNGM